MINFHTLSFLSSLSLSPMHLFFLPLLQNARVSPNLEFVPRYEGPASTLIIGFRWLGVATSWFSLSICSRPFRQFNFEGFLKVHLHEQDLNNSPNLSQVMSLTLSVPSLKLTSKSNTPAPAPILARCYLWLWLLPYHCLPQSSPPKVRPRPQPQSKPGVIWEFVFFLIIAFLKNLPPK